MNKNRIEKLENILSFFALCLIPLHLYLSFINVSYGIDKGYGHSFPLRSYVLIAVYLLTVLLIDLFMICKREFALSKGWSRYWASSCIGLVIALLLLVLAPENGSSTTLFLVYAPFAVLTPLLEFLGIGEGVPSAVAVALFCLFHWIVSRCFAERK